MFLSNILIITNPDISSINGACIFINFHSFGFNIVCSSGKNGMDPIKKLKQQSHEFFTPPAQMFLIPETKSKFFMNF